MFSDIHQVVSPHRANVTLPNGSTRPPNDNVQPNKPTGNQRNSEYNEGNLPLSAQRPQPHVPVNSPVTQRISVIHGAIHYQTDRTNVPTYTPQHYYGQYGQPTNTMQTQIQPNSVYRSPG